MSETLGVESTARYEVLSMEAHKQLELESRRGERQQLRHARAPISRARCGAIRTCGCWSRAAITTSAPRTARRTGRSRSSTRREDVLARVEHHYFDAGHMMYTREADMKKLKKDLAAWLRS